MVEIPVSSLYFTQQSAFGMLAIAKQSPHAHIVGKQGQQQCILTITLEVFKAFPKVGTEQRFCLPFCHVCRETFTRLQLMPIADVWIAVLSVQSLEVFHDDHGTLKRWQVCQPYPTLGKDRLAEQAQYTE